MTRAGAFARRVGGVAVALGLAATGLAGCGASPKRVGTTGVDGLTIPTPSPAAADFSQGSENPFFPLAPGTRWTYRQYLPTGSRLLVATVLGTSRRVDGIATTAVRWQVRTGGAVRPVMVRWYAVDAAGDVWWFGQRLAPRSPRIDRLATRSWVAGEHGAEAGVVLTAEPRVGDGYYNARASGVVARRSTVLSVTATVSTVQRTYRHAVATRDLSSLEPLHVVRSFYARGIGLVAQQDTRAVTTSLSLLRMTPG